MRVLTTAFLFFSALNLVAADPQSGDNKPHSPKNSTDGSLGHAPSTSGGHSHKHMRGSGSGDFDRVGNNSWDGSGTHGEKKKHHCDYPPMNSSMDGSDGSDGPWDGSRYGSRYHGPTDGSRGRPYFDCHGSNSSNEDTIAIDTEMPSAPSSATKQVVVTGGSLVMAGMYLLA